MDCQDWKAVVINKKVLKKEKISQNETKQKEKKLENETEQFTHKKLGVSFKKAIQQARLSQKITQKDLATKLNVKPSVINSYENGTCIPNNQFITHIERILKCKLPRGK